MFVSADRVSFAYDAPYVPVFTDISFNVGPEWKTAVVGRNGRGKSTLLHLIAGTLQPSSGTITHVQRPLLLAHTYVIPDTDTLSVMIDAVGPYRRMEERMDALLADGSDQALLDYADIVDDYHRMGGYTLRAHLEERADVLGLGPSHLERSFSTLSGGERTRALIAAVTTPDDGLALLDEPTNHLDRDGRRLVREYLTSLNKGFLVTSHDEELLEACCDHVLSIDADGLHVKHAGYAVWRRERTEQQAREQREQDNIRREVRTLEQAAERQRRWSAHTEREKDGAPDSGFVSHKAAKMMKRALHTERRIDDALHQAQSLLTSFEGVHTLQLRPADGAPDVVLQVADLSVRFGDVTILDGCSLTVRRGERIVVTGPNGCGKSTLVGAILGEVAYEGLVALPQWLRTIVVRQWPVWTSGTLRDHVREAEIDETRFRTILASFNVSGDVFDRPLETFSFGQWKKIDLCRSFLDPAHLFIWDEPMNGMDVETKEQLIDAIGRSSPTMLIIDHDRAVVEKIATDVIDLG